MVVNYSWHNNVVSDVAIAVAAAAAAAAAAATAATISFLRLSSVFAGGFVDCF